MPGIEVKATRAYLARAAKVLSEAEREALHRFIAQHPEAGDIVPGTGGIRKLRWGMAGQGKRGGARVLQLYLRHRETVWLLDIYSKREKADLSPKDVKAFRQLVASIKEASE
jgi:hypothetical protein